MAGALSAGLVSVAACQTERERFPPPEPYPGGTIGQTGGGGSGGGASSGGSGGATSTTATGPGPVLNVCECSFGLADSSACGSCANDITAPTKSCEDESTACSSDPACKTLLDCRLGCVGKPDAEKVTCIQGCYAMVDLSSPENHAFVNVMDCICNACAIKCAPAMAITCE